MTSAVQSFRDFEKITSLTEAIGTASRESWSQKSNTAVFESIATPEGRVDWNKISSVRVPAQFESFEPRFGHVEVELTDDDKQDITQELFSYLGKQQEKGKELINLEQLRDVFPVYLKSSSRFSNLDTQKIGSFIDDLIRQSPEEEKKEDLKDEGVDFGAAAEFPKADGADAAGEGVAAVITPEAPSSELPETFGNIETAAPLASVELEAAPVEIPEVTPEPVPHQEPTTALPGAEELGQTSEEPKEEPKVDDEIDSLKSELDSIEASSEAPKAPEAELENPEELKKPEDEEPVESKKFLESIAMKRDTLHSIRAQFEAHSEERRARRNAAHKSAVLESIKSKVLGNVGEKPVIKKAKPGLEADAEGEKKAKAKAAENIGKSGKLANPVAKIKSKAAKLEAIVASVAAERELKDRLDNIRANMFESINGRQVVAKEPARDESSTKTRLKAAFEAVQAKLA